MQVQTILIVFSLFNIFALGHSIAADPILWNILSTIQFNEARVKNVISTIQWKMSLWRGVAYLPIWDVSVLCRHYGEFTLYRRQMSKESRTCHRCADSEISCWAAIFCKLSYKLSYFCHISQYLSHIIENEVFYGTLLGIE